jgi:ADP-ribose pyrophosphatase YjhB (NUDIX family)
MEPRREYPDHPFVGVGALVHRDGKVLLVRRAKEPNKGKWIIPGGLVELGEPLEEAVLREVKEELGIDAKVEVMLDLASEVVLDENRRVKYHYVLIDYLVSPLQRDLVLNNESSSYDWFAPESVEDLETTENTKKMVRKFVEMTKAVNPPA